MRILHTSDWHLGKRLFKLDRVPEHQAFLDWLLNILLEQKIDLLLIAGDVFDTPTPPHQALEMFYAFLHRVSTETKTDTFIIAGNHDSGLLLEAPSKLLSTHRIKVWGKLSPKKEDHWVEVKKGDEEISICAIPFFRSHELLPQGQGDALTALAYYLEKKKTAPQLLMLHHLAGMYEAAGSEQVISLSGVDSIPSDMLKAFDYVALGHIHKPQKIAPHIFYSGSPIPLRFSETQEKSVIIIEQNKGTFETQILRIPIFRQLVTIKASQGQWQKKLDQLEITSSLTPMVELQLTLNAPRMGLIDEIKKILEKKGMELLSYLPSYVGGAEVKSRGPKLFELSHTELFEEFYASKFPAAPQVPDELLQDFKILLEKVKDASSQT